jgi:uncharacterized protein (TIGR00369 family)
MVEVVAGRDLEALRRWFNDLGAFSAAGIECIELRPGIFRARMTVPEAMRNDSGAINGGVLAFLADQAGGGASWTLVDPDHGPVTVSLSMNFLRPAMGGALEVVGTVARRGKSLAHLDIVVFDESGARCLTASGVWSLRTKRFERLAETMPR